MPYLQLTLHYHYPTSETSISDEDLSDWLISELGTIGFESFEQSEGMVKAFIPEQDYHEETTRELLTAFPLKGFTYEFTTEILPEVNWNEEWEKNYFQPILLGEGQCLIRAPFHDPRPELPMEIIISPKMAFGTGNHETTSLICSWLLGHDLGGLRVLDMGCGTGILGIIALRCGASSLTAIDIDPWAYENVHENAALNAVSVDEIICGDASALEGKAPYDLILANITRNILLEDMPRYTAVMHSGSRLLLSGFYEEDIPLLVERGAELGLELVSSTSRHRWALVELLKP